MCTALYCRGSCISSSGAALWFDSAGDVLLQWSPDGKKILFGIANGEVHVFDNTGNFIVSLLGLFSLWNFTVLMSLKRRPKKDTNERESTRKREERRERKEREWLGGGGG